MERLITRFEQGPVVDINPPDYETRVAILKKKAYQLNIEIPDEVYEFIASKIKSNIRELEGAVKKILLHHMLIKKDINIELAKEALKDIINEMMAIDSNYWFSLVEWSKSHNSLTPIELKTVRNYGTYKSRGKKLSYKEAENAKRIIEKAKELGFE